MADLSDLQAAQSVKIIGSSISGVENTPVQSTSNGGLHSNLRNNFGIEIGTKDNPIYTTGASALFSPLPSLKVYKTITLNNNSFTEITSNIISKTAITEFHVGGRSSCEGLLARYVASAIEQIPGGGFNSSVDVGMWTNTSAGSSALASWTYATDQFIEGTGSAKLTFTQSDNNNYPELTYVFSTPKNMSLWKQVFARIRVTVAAGGGQTRTVQIRLNSGTATRIYSITGTTTTAPFNTEQWLTIQADIRSPSSIAGTGEFDINNVNSISLRLQDGGNKTGSIWWDDIKLIGSLDILEKIYTTGQTIQLKFDPVIIFNIGEVLYLLLQNNTTTQTEFSISTSGVDIT